MNSPKILVSTHNNKTYMMTSYDLNSIIIFENPLKTIDTNGNVLVYYSSINIRKIS